MHAVQECECHSYVTDWIFASILKKKKVFLVYLFCFPSLEKRSLPVDTEALNSVLGAIAEDYVAHAQLCRNGCFL